jgi:fumarate hydratase class II
VITGRRQALHEPKLEIWAHLMDFPSDDKHNMQLDSNYIPNPAVNDRLSSRFDIPITMNIAYESDLVTSLAPYLMTISQLLSGS